MNRYIVLYSTIFSKFLTKLFIAKRENMIVSFNGLFVELAINRYIVLCSTIFSKFLSKLFIAKRENMIVRPLKLV